MVNFWELKIDRDVLKNPHLTTKDIVNDIKASGLNTLTKTVIEQDFELATQGKHA